MRILMAFAMSGLLVACGGSEPPPPEPAAPVAPAPVVAAPTGPTHGCFGQLAAAPLPEVWRDGYRQASTGGTALDGAGIACVLHAFSGPLKSPADFDPAYAPAATFHQEPAHVLATIPQQAVTLWRVGDDAGAGGVRLLRIDTGQPLEHARFDIIVVVAADGSISDHLLAGATGSLLQRTYDVSALQLDVRETTGRDGVVGPAYSAIYGVIGGEIQRVHSRLEPGAADAGVAVVRDIAGSSRITVPGPFGDLDALRTELFDDGIVEALLREQRDGDILRILAVGRSDTAGHVVHVLTAAGEQPDPASTTYVVASHQSVQPPNAVAAALGTTVWTPAAAGTSRITLAVTYTFLRDAADADDGGAGRYDVDAAIALRFDPGTGTLVAED